MATIAALDHSADADGRRMATRPKTASPHDHGWMVRRVRPSDAAAVKALFWKLHAFNASLDLRFALSAEWETHFDAAMEEALRGRESLCLIARECATGRPCGFALAAIHRDSGMWRHREWVEVEGLYVADAWRGRELGACLLARTCDWAKRVGQPVVQLYVTASNGQALRFYGREGFRPAQAILRRVLA